MHAVRTAPWRAFDAAWFARHQRALLAVLRWPIVGRWARWVLCIRPGDVGYRGRILRLWPHAYVVAQPTGARTLDCRTHAKYGKRIYHAFRPVWWALHAWDWAIADRWVPAWSYGLATLTVYPDVGSGLVTTDGTVGRVVVDETFAVIRAGAGNNASNSNATEKAGYLFASAIANQFQYLNRGGYLFDTSAIGTGSVSAATLSLMPSAKQNGLGANDVDIVALAPASNNVFVNADYGTIGAVLFGTITYAGATVGAYSDVVLNADGIAAVNPSGISKYGARFNWDRVGTFGGTWAANSVTEIAVYCADEAGTANDPKLVVTYSPQERNRVTIGQNVLGAVANFTNAASTSLAFPSAVTAGTLLTLTFTSGSSGATVSTVTDSVNAAGKWKLATRQVPTAASSVGTEIWYARDSSAGTPTVTVTLTSTAGGRFLFGIQSWTNASTNPLGTVASTSGTSSNCTAPTIAYSSGSVVVGVWKAIVGVTNRANPTGWSTLAPQNSSREASFYLPVTSTGSVSTKWQITTANAYAVSEAEFLGSTFTPVAARWNDGYLTQLGVQ